jgi:hypothetical protein
MGGLGLIILIAVVATTIWVAFDAPKRNWPEKSTGTTTWVIGCILLWIVVFPVYLVQRGKTTENGVSVAGASAALPQTEMYRTCPHCKEPMRRDASVCPHCRNQSAAWTLHDGRWWFRANEQDGWQWFDEPNNRWLKHELPSSDSTEEHAAPEPSIAGGEGETPESPADSPVVPRMLGEPIRSRE